MKAFILATWDIHNICTFQRYCFISLVIIKTGIDL